MTGERENGFPIYVNTHYVYCARYCVGLGRCDEALDWLDRYAKSEFLYVKKYREITKSTLPYLAGAEINYREQTRSAGENILDCLRWKWFDPIRDNPRFKSLVKAAEESIETK